MPSIITPERTMMLQIVATVILIPGRADATAMPASGDESVIDAVMDVFPALLGTEVSSEVYGAFIQWWEILLVPIIFAVLLYYRPQSSTKATFSKSLKREFASEKVPMARRESEEPKTPRTLQDFTVLVQEANEKRDWRSALQLLRRVQEAGLRPDTTVYAAAISACSKAGETSKSLALMQKMRREGLQPDELCLKLEAEALSKNNGRSDDVHASRGDGAQRPHQRVHYLTKAGYLKEGLELLYELWREGKHPNLIDCHSAIDAASKMGKGKEALEVLKDMREHGVEPDPPCFSAAIGALGKCGMWQRAVELLAEMETINLQPTVACYSAAIVACASGKQRELALDILTKLKASGQRPDVIAFNAAINSCAKTGAWEQAIDVLGDMQSAGVRPTLVSFSSVIHACAKSGSAHAAYVAQELMRRAKNEGLTPDVLMYNQCMDACQKCGQWQRALDLLGDMAANSLEPSAITHITAINACAAGDLVDEAVNHLEQMRAKGFELDVGCCDTVNRLLAKAGQWERALQIQDYRCRLKVEARRDHQNSHLHALNACAKNGRWANALQLLEDMRLQGRKPNQASVNALIIACTNCQMKLAWKKALEFLYEYDGCVGVSGYNAALHSCARNGKWECALEVLRDMQTKGVEVNKITYNTCMNACAKGHQWELALDLMTEMTQHKFEPDSFSYNAGIDATAKAGQWEKALALQKKMESEGLPLTVIGPTVVIHACCKAGQWKESLDVWLQARRNGLNLEQTTESAIVRTMTRRIKDAPDEEDMILAAMREHGLTLSDGGFD